MNILFYRYGSICEPDILAGFRTLGHQVTEITEEIYNKQTDAKTCLTLVKNALLSNTYDMVFSINFYPVVAEVCNIFKTIYACWIVDSPVLELYSYSIRKPYNRIFIFDRALYLDFVNENPNCIFHFPLATNVAAWDQVCDSITEEDRRKFSCDISFIGSTYEEKCPYNRLNNPPAYLKGYLDGLIAAQLKVYGCNFMEEVLTDDIVEEFKKYTDFYQFPENAVHNDKAVMAQFYLNTKVAEQERLHLLRLLSDHFDVDIYTFSDVSSMPNIRHRGSASTLIDMPKIFHLSKINLNITAKPIRTGLSLRIWDILGAGGFLISNYQEEIPDYFEIGKDLEVYASEDELMEKAAYYLEHEEERRTIAENGYNKVKAHHTYVMRLREMLEIIGF